jgi:hypothetical protein
MLLTDGAYTVGPCNAVMLVNVFLNSVMLYIVLKIYL